MDLDVKLKLSTEVRLLEQAAAWLIPDIKTDIPLAPSRGGLWLSVLCGPDGVTTRMGFFTQVAGIEVDGDRATARSYCLEILHLKNGDFRRLVGMYYDELVKENGDWLFARRNYEVLIDEGVVARP